MIDEADPKTLMLTLDGHLIERDGPFVTDLTCVDDFFKLRRDASCANRELKAYADSHDGITEEDAYARLHAAAPGTEFPFGE